MSTEIPKSTDDHFPVESTEKISVKLEMKSWRCLFGAKEIRALLADALNVSIVKTKLTLAGYLISDWTIYLILNGTKSKASEFVRYFEKLVDLEIDKKEQHQKLIDNHFFKPYHKQSRLFYEHSFYPNELYQTLIGQKIQKPYVDYYLNKEIQFLSTYNYCSVQDYKGGKGPVYVNGNGISSYTYGINLSNYDHHLWETTQINFDHYAFAIACFSSGVELAPHYQRIKKTMHNQEWICGGYHIFHAHENLIDQLNLYLSLNNWTSEPHFPPIVKVEIQVNNWPDLPPNFEQLLLEFLFLLEDETGQKPLILSEIKFAAAYLRAPRFSAYTLWIIDSSNEHNPVLPTNWADQEWLFCERSTNYEIEYTEKDIEIFNGSLEALNRFIKRD